MLTKLLVKKKIILILFCHWLHLQMFLKGLISTEMINGKIKLIKKKV